MLLIPPHTFSLLHTGVSTGCSFSYLISTCSGVGCCRGCSVDICSTVVLLEWQGDDLHYHGLLHGLQGNLCSSSWNISSSFSHFGLCRAVFSHSLPFFSQSVFLNVFFNTFSRSATILGEGLKCVLRWVCWSWLETDSPHKGHPCSTLLPKCCHLLPTQLSIETVHTIYYQ